MIYNALDGVCNNLDKRNISEDRQMNERRVETAVLGAGTAGLVALREIRNVNEDFALVNKGHYGTTCARVGCMPSKALIQVAHDYHRRHVFGREGIGGAAGMTINLEAVMKHVRSLRDRFTGGMIKKTERFGDRNIRGHARFLEPGVIDVEGQIIHAERVVIATGTHPVVPEEWREFGDRILTSDTIFEQETIPSSMAVIGLGVIGTELGQSLARLGVEVVGIGRSDRIAGLSDPEIKQAAADILKAEFELWQGHPAELEPDGDGLRVTAGTRSRKVEKALVCIGRSPNVEGLGLENLGVELRDDGLPVYNPETLQVGDLPIFIAGDVNGDKPILHEAWDDGRIAGYNVMQDKPACFKRRTPLAVTFSDPNIAVTGRSYADLKTIPNVSGKEDFSKQGRAIIKGEDHGTLKIYASPETGRLLGSEMIAPDGEHLAHLLAWAIQKNMTVFEALRMPFYHPVTEEGVRMALQNLAAKVKTTVSPMDMTFCEETPADTLS